MEQRGLIVQVYVSFRNQQFFSPELNKRITLIKDNFKILKNINEHKAHTNLPKKKALFRSIYLLYKEQ